MSNLLYPVDEKDRRIAELEAALKLSEEFDQDWDEAVALARVLTLEDAAKVAETHESSLGRPAQSLWDLDDDRRMLKAHGLEIANAIRTSKPVP